MRHYQLVPVRYNAQQLLVRCEPVDAELWSIIWRITTMDPPPSDLRLHWFADVAPLERETADAIVTWLNARERFAATLPRELESVTPFRST